jgi:shikimate kinase
MGSGKSTLGKKMALLMKMPFYDLDDYIERRENKTLSELFAAEGEAAFREKEAVYLKQLLLEEPFAVIALGGGTVCFNQLLEFVKSKGILIYLYLPPTALVQRLSANKNTRPLIKDLDDTRLQEFVYTTLEARSIFYEQAHLKINGINLRPEHLINEIKSLL